MSNTISVGVNRQYKIKDNVVKEYYFVDSNKYWKSTVLKEIDDGSEWRRNHCAVNH